MRGPLLLGHVIPLHDLPEGAVGIADDPAVIPAGVVDCGDGGLGAGPAMLLDHCPNAVRGQQRRVAVDHQHVPLLELLGGDLLDGVPAAQRLALVDDLSSAVEVSGHLGVVGADDGLDVGGAGPGHGVDHPVDHGPAADRMEHLRGARPHPGAVTGGEDDSR